ncbi:C1 family peptidase [Luteimonas deserti]|uniref:C1 family peptidase n=1 Tax=Luteimonas deserti TaxID=2752306 RepID=A0A7Z0QST7_9GAMM|nr:C1 family peptidase [Luteimonas deserti]NYZ63167.1 C1 family peptidase [Luteimonas deserti]
MATQTPTRRRAPRTPPARRFDARPDTADFRDRMFEPTLVDVPSEMPLAGFTALRVPVLDQGGEGACTAYGLATVAHALLRRRRPEPVTLRVSTRMLYDMARRYDEWEGEDYEGSSCRGAMKGWHRHGVCAEDAWPDTAGPLDEVYTEDRARAAQAHPLGAYYRVNHKDLVAMHAAFAEVGVLYASSAVHAGWLSPPASGVIEWAQQRIDGYHAFAIVGYDQGGFWIQNSWGTRWGRRGFGWVSYDEWLQRGTDVWVARLAVPVRLQRAQATAASNSILARQSNGYAQADLRPHVVSLGNDGRLRTGGRFGTTQEAVRNLVREDLPRITRDWPKKRVVLYAHGGLVPEQAAIQRVADLRELMLPQQVYPLCFVWKSDLWSTLGNILRDAVRPRSEGLMDRAKGLLLDRIDDTIEPLARTLGGKALWDEMKENARLATTAVVRDGDTLTEAGGAAQVARLLGEWMQADPDVELHLVGHSAGSILLAPLAQLLTTRGLVTSGPAAGMQGLGLPVASVSLWAPAMTMGLFEESFAPALADGRIGHGALFTLSDQAEQDDHCARVYNKSLLYLVAHAFEARARSWVRREHRHGTPLLGMARFIELHDGIRDLLATRRLDWIQAPVPSGPVPIADRSAATTHGGFDDDPATLQATVARIVGQRDAVQGGVRIHRSEAGLEACRQQLCEALDGQATRG